MSSFRAMDISATALTAERLRMEVISSNVANAASTRSGRGGAYRRLMTVLTADDRQVPLGGSRVPAEVFTGSGVRVLGVVEDRSPLPLVYDPDHPDANAEGYVAMPNVDPAMEMVDLIAATRAYEANVTVLNATKQMAMKALEIGRA